MVKRKNDKEHSCAGGCPKKTYPFKKMTKKLREGAFTAKANKAGMSVARYATKMVDKYDGDIKLESEPEKGLKYIITFPI